MDTLTPEQRRRNMQSIKSVGTKPEQKVMQALKDKKIYFASHSANIFGRPDIIFRRKKVVIFIDSDFWHGHPTRLVMPKSNQAYWIPKIDRNRERDKQV